MITFLTNIYFDNIEDGDISNSTSVDGAIKHDILGRGIDFSFRLEKFGGASHYCINRMFYECASEYISNKDKFGNARYDSIEVSKNLKGWDDSPQKFYILTNNKMITSSPEKMLKVDENDGSVQIELLTHYVDILKKGKTPINFDDSGLFISEINKIKEATDKIREEIDRKKNI